MKLVEHFKEGLDAPICLSSSGRRDPRELSTAECKSVIDELQRMQVFYVNIGGGEPTVRPDFWELLDYAVSHDVGVKFSTNGVRLTPARARRLAASDYVDVQISLDGATAVVNDAVRGPGSYVMAMKAMENLADAGFENFKISAVMTRHNIAQLDEFKAIADRFKAQLRITRLRPSGRGADVWDDLHPLPEQQLELYDWLVSQGENVLTGDSFFHLNALGSTPLPGLNLCGAGRAVCLIDPVGDVYACPFAIHDEFLAGNVRDPGGFAAVWRGSELFVALRRPQTGGACQSCSAYDSCQGGCMAAKFFTGLPLDGPGWLDALLPLFDDPAVAAAAPRIRGIPGTSVIADYDTTHSPLDLGPRPANVRPNTRISYVPSAALVVRRHALADVGGFDEQLRYGEDVDLIWRLVTAGYTVRYQPTATVWHRPRPTTKTWLSQRFHYGTSAAPLAERHPSNLAPTRLSGAGLAAAALAVTGHPLAALLLATITTARTPRALRRTGLPTGAALALAARGQVTAYAQLLTATRRTWWPATLLTRRGRQVLLASLIVCLLEAAKHGRGPRWAALRVLDDLTFGAGVWAGCLTHRTIIPLRPRLPLPR